MHRFTAHTLRDAVAKGELTASAIASHTLKRIAAQDPKLSSFLSVHAERMMQKAEAVDEKRRQGKKIGKLAGVPIAVKDNIHIQGEITTCGSKFLAQYRAVFDASVVRLLEEEDALLVGKTNLDEFAMGSSTESSAFFKTKNPWNLSYSPGGSSGGSAAAVAARLCPVALGSDTGGSIRQPGSFCGIVGFKPSYGRVSRYGLVAFASSLDQIGPLTTNVADAALILEIIGQHCSRDATSLAVQAEPYVAGLQGSIQGTKIGVPWSLLRGLSQEAAVQFQESIRLLEELGASVVEVDLRAFDHSVAVYYVLATAEASTNLARFDGIRYGTRSARAGSLDEIYEFSRQEGFGAEVKQRILLGTYVLSSGYKEAYYRKAQQVRTLIIEQCARAFAQCDVIAMPTTPGAAFPIGGIQDPLELYLQDIYTIPANLAGLPAISVPSGLNSEGLPFGLQLMAPQMQDARVLRFAQAFETKRGLLCPKEVL